MGQTSGNVDQVHDISDGFASEQLLLGDSEVKSFLDCHDADREGHRVETQIPDQC